MDVSLSVAGVERSYRVHLPAGREKAKGLPLVVYIAPGLGSYDMSTDAAGFSPLADKEGFVAVYPRPWQFGWNVGSGCCGQAYAEKAEDVRFIVAVLARVRKDQATDPRRVYLAGQSTGGMLAQRVASEHAGQVAAVGEAAAPLMSECKPSRPVPIIMFHGDADVFTPWAGGPSRSVIANNGVSFASVPATRDAWVKADGCTGKGKTVYRKDLDKDGKATVCRSMAPCAAGSDVVLCTVGGGGHSWPGGKPFMPLVMGTPSKDVSATKEMWKFFKAHPLPEDAK